MDEHIRFPCPACGKRLKAPQAHAGRRARCSCGQSVVVPSPEPLPLDDAPLTSSPAPKRVAGIPSSRLRLDETARTPSPRSAWPWLAAGAAAILLAVGGGAWFLTRERGSQGQPQEQPERSAAVPKTPDRTEGQSEPTQSTTQPSSPGASPDKPTDQSPPKTTPAPPERKLAELLIGDWESVGGDGWKVSFTKAGGIIITTPSVGHFAFYSFVSEDTIKFPAPPPAAGGADATVKLKVTGDELTMTFDGGPTIKLARARGRPAAGTGETADRDKLKGTWRLAEIKWAEEGKTSTLLVSSKSYLVIDGDQMTDRNEGDDGKVTEAKYQLTLDAGKKPAVYQQKAFDGKNKDRTTTGIYRIDGDTLLMCSKGDGLPADFTITQGRDVKDKYLYTYKREKK